MATVRVTSRFFSNPVSEFDFSSSVMDWQVLERTRSTFEVGEGISSLTFEGTGFRYRGRGDVTDVTDGRIGSIVFQQSGEATFTFTGVDRSAARFFGYVYDDFEVLTPGGQRPIAYLLSGRDRIFGGDNEDVLSGYRGNYRLYGRLGDDRLRGDRGADRLFGGQGFDTLSGGSGDDVFVFNTPADNTSGPFGPSNFDTITDFSRADDRILIENAVFTALGRVGDLRRAQFDADGEGIRASTRIIKDGAAIYYDPDGSGAAERVLIAQVTAALTLSSADFLVI